MASQLHFLVFPFMAQGHITPMVDIAKLFAQLGVIITIVTSPVNAIRIKPLIDRAIQSGLKMQVLEHKFPCAEAGLPDGCEALDMIPSLKLRANFYEATSMLSQHVEKLLDQTLSSKPNCVISDMSLPYTIHIAKKFNVPRISFNGMNCFSNLCFANFDIHNIVASISSEDEEFLIPGIPDTIKITKSQLPAHKLFGNMEKFTSNLRKAEQESYGMIVNTFTELETEYVNQYKNMRGDRVWCVGPVSLCNKGDSDKAERGCKSSIEDDECTKWLDSRNPRSVLYVCLGSRLDMVTEDLIQLALGLEESSVPFMWAIREREENRGFTNWVLENGYEERIKARGLLMKGWAPQILILSHESIGGFLTHCGWNSSLESISNGVPMITLPLSSEQFLNEKLVVQVCRIGVEIGVKGPLRREEDDDNGGDTIEKENVKAAIGKLMGEGEEKEEMRQRARKYGDMANNALHEGGSSHLNMKLFTEEIRKLGSISSTSILNS